MNIETFCFLILICIISVRLDLFSVSNSNPIVSKILCPVQQILDNYIREKLSFLRDDGDKLGTPFRAEFKKVERIGAQAAEGKRV